MFNLLLKKNTVHDKKDNKPIPSNASEAFEEDLDNVVGTQNQRKKPVKEPPKFPKHHGFYWVGDLPFMLFYRWDEKIWSKIDFNENSAYKGGLKYPSVVRICKSDTIVFTGGCDNNTGEASDWAFKATIPNIDLFESIAPMSSKRYGHWSISVDDGLYAIGGFDHQDTETTSPSTLISWEKYNQGSDKWEQIADLVHSVAFAAIWNVNQKEFYLFGGFEDYSTVDIIQKYDCDLNKWKLLEITLPVKLAKMGAANIENSYIIIIGGIYEDVNSENPLSLISNSYKLNLYNNRWSTGTKMKNKRTLNSTLYLYDNQLYALGSSNQGACEKYDLEASRWINIPQYDHILPMNDLQSFSVCKYDE